MNQTNTLANKSELMYSQIFVKIWVKVQNTPLKESGCNSCIKFQQNPHRCEIQIQAGCAVGTLEVYTELTKLDT